MDLREGPLRKGRRHPWEQARIRALQGIIRSSTRLRASANAPRVLDVGCGDGFAVDVLARAIGAREAVGLDRHLSAEQRAALAQLYPNVRFIAHANEIGSERFELITLLDVLEHVEDDLALLTRACGHARQGAWVLVTVPAFQCLFSDHDRYLGHYRRYTREQLIRLVQSAGLTVERSGYLFGSLLAPRAASCALQRFARPETGAPEGEGEGDWHGGRVFTALMRSVLSLDNDLLVGLAKCGMVLPGLTAWVLCRVTRPDR